MDPRYVRRTIADLEGKRVRWILWPPTIGETAEWRPLAQYIEGHYQREQAFPDFEEAWKRRP
jgi:hypothetical protein